MRRVWHWLVLEHAVEFIKVKVVEADLGHCIMDRDPTLTKGDILPSFAFLRAFTIAVVKVMGVDSLGEVDVPQLVTCTIPLPTKT